MQLNTSFPELLLRVAHVYEAGDDPVLSQPVTIELGDYFKFASITGMSERTLTGVHDVSYLQYSGARLAGVVRPTPTPPTALNNFAITLQPTEIRTFYIKLQAN